MAEEFKDSPGVMGYELLNEPWADVADHPLSDAKTLMPLYKTLAAAIREVDTEHLIFFEDVATNTYTGVVGTTTDFPKGGIPIPGRDENMMQRTTVNDGDGDGDDDDDDDETALVADPNQVFAYHIYWAPQTPGTIMPAWEKDAWELYVLFDATASAVVVVVVC